MTTATLSRGSESVSFPVINDAGTPLVSRDYGKTNHEVIPTGDPNPRSAIDALSGSEILTITPRLYDFDTALDLVDLVKAHSGGTATTLDLPLGEFGDDLEVFPAAGQDEAISLEYVAGADRVDVDLSLSRVDEVKGTDSGFRADTPRASGDGPIVLGDGQDAVAFGSGTVVERSVGRPGSEAQSRYTDHPVVIDHRKSSYDAIELTLASVSNAVSVTGDLLDLFRERRGRDTLTLNFNGHFRMGSFNVVPDGSGAIRHVRIAGRKGSEDMSVPTIKLRVVQ